MYPQALLTPTCRLPLGWWLALVICLVCWCTPLHAAGWSTLGDMPTARRNHTATLLADGQVLFVGGLVGGLPSNTVQRYDPSVDRWTAVAPMSQARHQHTAVVLADRRVLVVGGLSATGALASSELYDPDTNSWSATGNLAAPRRVHTASVLRDGKVLVTGGWDDTLNAGLASAERFDPATGTWSNAGTMAIVRYSHAAAVLPDGRVLVTGGNSGSVQRYDPVTNSWSAAASLPIGLITHSLTLLGNGKVLLAGGYSNGLLSDTRLYDPIVDTWTLGPALPAARAGHHASLLPTGRVLLFGGNRTLTEGHSSGVLYDPTANTVSNAPAMSVARRSHASVLLADGRLLVGGGIDDSDATLASLVAYEATSFSFSDGPALNLRRENGFTTTTLTDGRVLITGGRGQGSSNPYGSVRTVEAYNPATGSWAQMNDLIDIRLEHRATLLADGRVFVHGGLNAMGQLHRTSEIFDPATGIWTSTPLSQTGHQSHTQMLLADGRVLVVGGPATPAEPISEIFDPATSTWTPAANPTFRRFRHASVRLADGRIMIISGRMSNNSGFEPTAEIYDPNANAWSQAGSLSFARTNAEASLLPDGRVLVACGEAFGNAIPQQSEIYDPATNSWSQVGVMFNERNFCTATVLRDGRVLVVGGIGLSTPNSTRSAEIFDVLRMAWQDLGSFPNSRYGHGAAQLADGRVLLIGGFGTQPSGTSMLFDPNVGRDASRLPVLFSVPATLGLGNALSLTGSGFAPAHTATSGATASNASNIPVVRIQRVDNGRTFSLQGSAVFSDTSMQASAGALSNIGTGPVDVSVAVNGVSSQSRRVNLVINVPGAPPAVLAQAGNGRAHVRFPIPTPDGGSPITSYTVFAAPGGANASCTAPCGDLIVTGLTNGTTYTFTVRATNAMGIGAPSAPSNAVTPGAAACDAGGLAVQIGVQEAPRCANSSDGVLVAAGSGGIGPYAFQWTPGGASGTTLSGVGAGPYQVMVTDALACTRTTAITVVAPSPLTVSVQRNAAFPRGTCNGSATASGGGGLAPYGFAWTPSNQNTATASALCAGSHTVTVTDANQCTATSSTTIIEPPAAPTITSVTPGDAQVSVSFDAPSSDGGAPVDSYRATCGGVSVSGAGSPIVVGGLENGESVTCFVRAVNAAGQGDISAASVSVTPLAPQTIVFDSTPTLRLNQSVTVAATGGSSGQPVIFESRTLSTCTTSGTNGATVQGVAVGTCTIAANQAGSATFAPAPEATLSFAVLPPLRMVTPLVDFEGMGNIAPATPQSVAQGDTIAFVITPQGTNLYTVEGTCGGTLVGNTFTTAPVQQDCTVIAHFYNVPGIITNFAMVPLDGGVRVEAVPPPSGNSAILDYTATCMPGPIEVVSTAPPLFVTGLTNNFVYRCNVKARNIAGFGTPSATRSVIPGTAGTVADLVVTIDNGRDFVDGHRPVDYLVTVVNLGPAGATNVPVIDDPGLAPDFVSATWTCAAPAAARCGTPSGTLDLNARVDLPVNVPVEILYSALPDPNTETPVSRIVSLLVPSNLTDPNLDNNVASDGPDIRGIFRDEFE